MTSGEVKSTQLEPGDVIIYGGREATVQEQWRWDDNVGIKLRGYIGWIHLSRWDTVRLARRNP